MDSAQAFVGKIMELIAQDDLNSAIREVQQLLKGSPLFDEAVLQSARYNDVMKSIRLGLVDPEHASLEKNKIRYALIDMLRELEEQSEKNPALETQIQTFLKETAQGNRIQIAGDKNIAIQGVSGSQIRIDK